MIEQFLNENGFAQSRHALEIESGVFLNEVPKNKRSLIQQVRKGQVAVLLELANDRSLPLNLHCEIIEHVALALLSKNDVASAEKFIKSLATAPPIHPRSAADVNATGQVAVALNLLEQFQETAPLAYRRVERLMFDLKESEAQTDARTDVRNDVRIRERERRAFGCEGNELAAIRESLLERIFENCHSYESSRLLKALNAALLPVAESGGDRGGRGADSVEALRAQLQRSQREEAEATESENARRRVASHAGLRVVDEIALTPGSARVNSVTFSLDGQMAAVGDSSGRLFLLHFSSPASPATSATSALLLGPPKLILSNEDKLRGTALPDASTDASSSTSITAVMFSGDGEVCAVGDTTGGLRLVHLPSSQVLARFPRIHQGAITSIAFHPSLAGDFGPGRQDDSKCVVDPVILSSGVDGLVRLTNMESGICLASFDAGCGTRVNKALFVYHNDSSSAQAGKSSLLFVAAAEDGKIRIFSTRTQQLIHSFTPDNTQATASSAFDVAGSALFDPPVRQFFVAYSPSPNILVVNRKGEDQPRLLRLRLDGTLVVSLPLALPSSTSHHSNRLSPNQQPSFAKNARTHSELSGAMALDASVLFVLEPDSGDLATFSVADGKLLATTLGSLANCEIVACDARARLVAFDRTNVLRLLA